MSEQKELIQPGWYKKLPEQEYHTSNGTSSTTLKNWLQHAPNECLHKKLNPKDQSEAMKLGSLVHAFVLEPDIADTCYEIMPEFNLRTKHGREGKLKFMEDHEGVIITTKAQLEQAQMMADSVLKHPEAKLLLEDSINESSIYWWYKKRDDNDERDYKEIVKVRPDCIPQNYPVLVDLKTCDDATYLGFQKSIQKFFYHMSAAMYLNGVNQCEELKKELEWPHYKHFVFIAVSKTPAFCTETKKTVYNTGVYSLDEESLDMGNVLYRTAMRRMFDGKKEQYPGIPHGIRDMSLTPWAKNIPSI